MEFPKGTLSDKILECAVKVHSVLGPGFLEKVYENALAYELRKAGLFVEQQKPIPVYYEDQIVGDYVADLMVQHKVVVELKAIKALTDEHQKICLNYLCCCRQPLCLLLNFGAPRLGIKRLVGTNYPAEPNPL